MRFRKKPVTIDAELFVASVPYCNPGLLPDGVCVGDGKGRCVLPPKAALGYRRNGFHVHTLEGVMKISDGDWIITGVKGERYPCKPDIFAASYEPVEARAIPKKSLSGNLGARMTDDAGRTPSLELALEDAARFRSENAFKDEEYSFLILADEVLRLERELAVYRNPVPCPHQSGCPRSD